MSEEKRINPQITKVEIGIREMRDIDIYPLSMSDQLKLTDVLSTAIGAFAVKEDGDDIALVSFIVKLINENLGRILGMVADEDGEKLLEEISNIQAASIAEIIYETNYGVVAKNLKSLFGKMSMFFPSERPLPQSVSPIPDTDSNTSTESPIGTEESPTDS